MKSIKNLLFFFILIFGLPCGIFVFAQNKSDEKLPPMPKLLSQREQLRVRSEWLKKRLDTIVLPMMRKHNVSMWIVTNEEFHAGSGDGIHRAAGSVCRQARFFYFRRQRADAR